MKRLAAYSCSALLTVLVVAPACSGDDDGAAPPLSTGGSGAGGRGGTGGRPSGGATANGGVAGADEPGGATPGGAAGSSGGGDGGSPDVGGAAGVGGEPFGTGGEPSPPPPPDLIEATGGPWPDSLTGICSNGATLSTCPQKGAPYFGQDGTYRLNVPSYTATATQLTDAVTGLTWQVSPPKEPLTQSEAASYCDGLELGGHDDWRLPSRVEYVSLLDEGKGAGYALPPAVPFDATGTYWTSSTSGVTVGLFFVVDDAVGGWNVVVEDSESPARCVRGAALTGSLQAEGGVVTDSMTGLVWQASELEATTRTWAEALDYCESLVLAGKSDWRLPSIKELATLVDEAAVTSPVIAAVFGAEAAKQYWSSTPTEPFLSSPAAFVLDTDFGIAATRSMTESIAARCVGSAG
jgi:Protein of unknown function (DUF1566)